MNNLKVMELEIHADRNEATLLALEQYAHTTYCNQLQQNHIMFLVPGFGKQHSLNFDISSSI